MTTQSVDLLAILPAVLVFAAALAVVVADLFLPAPRRGLAMPVALAGTLAAVGAAAYDAAGGSRATFCVQRSCSYVEDPFAVVLQVLVLLAAAVVLLLGRHETGPRRLPPGEYHFLLLCSVTGMVVIAAARDLLIVLVALEVVSLPAFVLVGLRQRDARAGESAVKFFLFSVISSAVTLLGIALVYGVTGALHFDRVAAALASPASHAPVTDAAVVLTLAGFAFKVSAVPFHFWAPDTYEGAPVPIAAFLSVASKAAGFAGLSVVVLDAFRPYATTWGPVLAALAAATMTVGNLAALRQGHAVRLLAWSSVAQAGYILAPLGIVAGDGGRVALSATVSYLAFYAVMNLGAFGCVVALARSHPAHRLADYRGLVHRDPWVAVAFAFFLACLAGIPPGVAGLFAKVVVFRALAGGALGWLAAVMAVNTVIGLYYYARIAFSLFAEPRDVDLAGRPRDAAAGGPRDAAAGRPRDAAAGRPRDAADGRPRDAADGADDDAGLVVVRPVPRLVTAAVAIAAAGTVALSAYPQFAVHAGDVAASLLAR